MQLVELPMMLKARVKVAREDLTPKSLNKSWKKLKDLRPLAGSSLISPTL
jgi:hypothetical protein